MESEYVNLHTHRPAGRGIEPTFLGIHPWDAEEADTAAVERRLGEVQAVGEIGLDYLRGPERELQRRVFRAQLALAETRRMPVVIHCVKALDDVLRELEGRKLPAVIFHGFTGSREQAQRVLARGCYLSFGHRTFSSPKTTAALRGTPLDRLFLETDDDPTPIEEIYRRAAETLGIAEEELRRATTQNYERIFTKRNG